MGEKMSGSASYSDSMSSPKALARTGFFDGRFAKQFLCAVAFPSAGSLRSQTNSLHVCADDVQSTFARSRHYILAFGHVFVRVSLKKSCMSISTNT